jgi:SAM-dependent methyltransferase
MERTPEPELMDDAAQAAAYAAADFEEPHARFVELFRETFPADELCGEVLDLGCGPADISLRLARAYPRCVVHGVDGAEAMLAEGRARLAREGLGQRVRLSRAYLPGADLPAAAYAAVISNSLLHHLRDPAALWTTARRCGRPGAPLFVMDLCRPAGRAEAAVLVDEYAAGEPAVLRHDFFHSLLAAYRPEEVAAQLRDAGLTGLAVAKVSDRHLLIHGRLP